MIAPSPPERWCNSNNRDRTSPGSPSVGQSVAVSLYAVLCSAHHMAQIRGSVNVKQKGKNKSGDLVYCDLARPPPTEPELEALRCYAWTQRRTQQQVERQQAMLRARTLAVQCLRREAARSRFRRSAGAACAAAMPTPDSSSSRVVVHAGCPLRRRLQSDATAAAAATTQSEGGGGLMQHVRKDKWTGCHVHRHLEMGSFRWWGYTIILCSGGAIPGESVSGVSLSSATMQTRFATKERLAASLGTSSIECRRLRQPQASAFSSCA